MATRVTEDIAELWKTYKKDQTNQELRNILIERSSRSQEGLQFSGPD